MQCCLSSAARAWRHTIGAYIAFIRYASRYPRAAHQSKSVVRFLRFFREFYEDLFESERLLFRELLPSDEEGMFELDSDPEVVRYTGDKPLTHIDQTRENIAVIRQQYQNFGIGRWAAVLKETQEFIGWAGLKYIKKLNGRKDNYDLGYRFLKRHWGKGYGTESAKAFVNYGFNEMQLKRISAYADVEHIASLKILEKCGLKFTNTFTDDGNACAWYEIVDSTLNCDHHQ